MSLIARLAAAGLGAGILVAGAGSALAAPAEDSADSTSTDATSTDSAATDAGPTGGPAGGPAPTYVLDGVGVPFADPSLGVPKILEAGILPLGLIADAAGQEGSTATENGAQGTPGSAES